MATRKTTTAKTAAEAPSEAGATETPAQPQEAASVAHDPRVDPFVALRAPFPPEAIGKLPKGTCKACRDMARSYRACEAHSWVRRCDECGNSHSNATIHLDYVGHADVTDRLLAVDPRWTWTPFTSEQISALPPVLREAGLWINLTVNGVTRPGFGDAQGKTGPNAVKEMIGDALRNAAMRFGVSLDLWAKGDRDWAKAADETPEQVATPQERLAADRGHTRQVALDDMRVQEMPVPDQRRWRVHMDTLTADLSNLTPEQMAAVQQNWPEGMPTPKSGAMTINEIKTARALVADLTAQRVDTPAPAEDEPPF